MLPAVIAGATLFLRVVAHLQDTALPSIGVGILLGIATAFKQVAGVTAIFFVMIFPFLAGAGFTWHSRCG